MDLFEVSGDTDSQNIDVEDKDLQLALEGLKSAVTKDQQNDSQKSTLRPPPESDEQPDFFVPSLVDIPVKDSISLMEVAVFRLSKRNQRKGEVIRYELNKATIEVTAGGYGMATVWDYDIVLMCISHLAAAIKRHRMGRGEMPSKIFRPHSTEILKFCRLNDGGKQYESVEAALDRLKNTTIKVSTAEDENKLKATAGFGLIETYKVVGRTDTGKIGVVEIIIPDWIYDAVVTHKNPDVLTFSPDYFLIDKGLARFIYRLSRKSAGKNEARYLFRTIYERSGSAASFKEFCRMLRAIAKSDDLPDYVLAEEKGKGGPVLRMTARASIAK